MIRYEELITEILLLVVNDLLPGSIQMNIPPAGAREVSEIIVDSKTRLALNEFFKTIEDDLLEENNLHSDTGDAQEIFSHLRKDPIIYSKLTRAIAEPLLTSYYQRPEVLLGLGLDNKAPFPQGNLLKQSDLSMLEPVYSRGSIYREVDEV